ncbi:MAG: EthD family reductase [Deltaproteobacteria bacterium]|nr:EthD family reductase [Deltaproteobacteria bacterium]MBW2136036.1 EthD family reductase [Deltaproteobacteria bacterium]
MIRVSVMYPNQGGKFDLDYYMNNHVPLVHKLLDPYGLVRVEVDKGIGTARPGAPAPFVAIAHLVFDSLDRMQEGLKAHDPELAADLANFTDIQPQFQISEILY